MQDFRAGTLGIFLSASIANLFYLFPGAIIGGMMLMVGIELTKFARDLRPDKNLIPMGVTVTAALLSNMFFGFLAGLLSHYILKLISPGASSHAVPTDRLYEK